MADFLLVKNHTAVGLVDRMVKIGLLKRFRNSGDGRRILGMLTHKGERHLSNVAELNWAELRSLPWQKYSSRSPERRCIASQYVTFQGDGRRARRRSRPKPDIGDGLIF
nr:MULTISPECIES: MarR family winged helix-turn-helix transcriptional regulator [unclassified Bradyrhizobium]